MVSQAGQPVITAPTTVHHYKSTQYKTDQWTCCQSTVLSWSQLSNQSQAMAPRTSHILL